MYRLFATVNDLYKINFKSWISSSKFLYSLRTNGQATARALHPYVFVIMSILLHFTNIDIIHPACISHIWFLLLSICFGDVYTHFGWKLTLRCYFVHREAKCFWKGVRNIGVLMFPGGHQHQQTFLSSSFPKHSQRGNDGRYYKRTSTKDASSRMYTWY